MNSVFLVYSISDVHFFFFFPSSMPVGLSFVFVFVFCFLFFLFLNLYMFTTCTCNASLHGKYTKAVNIVYICTKNGKYSTNFVNVYKICQFFLCLQYKFTL